MPQGVIFFRLIHLGAQLSLWALSTGTLLFIAHRNFKIYSADLCVCLCMCVCVLVSACMCRLLSWSVKMSVSLNAVQKTTKQLENALLTEAFKSMSVFQRENIFYGLKYAAKFGVKPTSQL